MTTDGTETTEEELDTIFNDVAEEGGGDNPPIEAAAEKEESEPTLESLPEAGEAEAPAENSYAALEAEHEKLKHQYKSDEGRIAALQRKVSSLENVNSTLKKPAVRKASPPPLPTRKPNPVNAKKIVEDLYSGDEKKAQSAVLAITQGNTANQAFNAANVQKQVDQMLKPLREAEQAKQKLGQEEALEKAFPNWKVQVNEPHFEEWLQGRSETVKKLVHSSNSADAIELLTYYNSSVGNVTEEDTGKTQVEKVQDKRAKQLNASSGISSKSAGSSGAMPTDPDALFDYLERNDPDLRR
jgi:hypothetical protein